MTLIYSVSPDDELHPLTTDLQARNANPHRSAGTECLVAEHYLRVLIGTD
uniref:Uncharacterized protein n=1 Tax=uncultured marine group II/III euryarchaeote AD1000_73_F05 TaxID=1457806 RepID=A0A075FY77_9EURY|nr:hypothetical protein [uncultured marine group II/III euryarchaeote AD1000_73_F05]